MVLIHGWPLSAQAWEPQVSTLREAGYCVAAYDLQRVFDQCELQDVTLVGSPMGGGDVARYVTRYGESRLRSVVFAAAVPPFLMKTADNPEGPLKAHANAPIAR